MKAGPSGERLGEDEAAVDHSQLQHREAARRRPADDLGPLPQVVGRVMERAFEKLPVGVSVRDVAPGMHAYGRLGDDTVGGMLLCFGIEAHGIEAQQQHLVERPAPHRIHSHLSPTISAPRGGDGEYPSYVAS